MCWDSVKALDLKYFEWNEPVRSLVGDKRMLGWIAQEVKEVFPKAVGVCDMYDIPDCHTLSDDQLHKAAFGALQKAIGIIETMQTSFEALEARVRDLEARLSP